MRKFVVAAMSGLLMAGTAHGQALSAPAPAAAPAADPQNILNIDLSTGGRVKILLRPDKAPYSVERMKILVRRHFYDGLIFHRVIEGFMAQGGDPKGTGEGGSELPDLKAEFNDLPHVRGTLSLARAEGLDSANSQFFIMLQPNLNLDGNYTAIGRVISGMEYVDAIEKGEPPEKPSKVVRASIESDELGQAPAEFVAPPPKPAVAAAAPTTKQARKAKKQDDKRAKEQAEDDAKAKAKQAKTDAKATKEAEEQAAKDKKQADKAAKDAAEQTDKAAKAQAAEAEKAAKAEAKAAEKAAKDAERAAKAAPSVEAPAPAPSESALPPGSDAAPAPVETPPQTDTPPSTDQAVQAMSTESSTAEAVQAVAADGTVAQPQ